MECFVTPSLPTGRVPRPKSAERVTRRAGGDGSSGAGLLALTAAALVLAVYFALLTSSGLSKLLLVGAAIAIGAVAWRAWRARA
jgi:Flp pilus assembly protein TadB